MGKVFGPGATLSADYVVCPLCPTCRHFSTKKSNYPYVCDKGSTATAFSQAKSKNGITLDSCKCYKPK